MRTLWGHKGVHNKHILQAMYWQSSTKGGGGGEEGVGVGGWGGVLSYGMIWIQHTQHTDNDDNCYHVLLQRETETQLVEKEAM